MVVISIKDRIKIIISSIANSGSRDQYFNILDNIFTDSADYVHTCITIVNKQLFKKEHGLDQLTAVNKKRLERLQESISIINSYCLANNLEKLTESKADVFAEELVKGLFKNR